MLVGLLAALIMFGRRAQRSAISQIEGKPGAAASVLGLLRRGWKVEPGIAFNRHQDVAHRLVGPPGIVLIGEGNPNRLRPLLTSERRKHERVASEATITEIVVGDDTGQVPLRRLVKHVTKLPEDAEAGRDDRRPRPAQGAGLDALEHPAAQGPGADVHEGRTAEHEGPLAAQLEPSVAS